MSTQERFRQAWRDLSLAPPPHLFAALQSAYSEPHRRYHTERHLDECFAALDGCGVTPRRAPEFELALWFHDSVYDPRKKDNELRSADWAARELRAANAPLRVIHHVHALILATSLEAKVGKNLDAALLVDIDLAILGAQVRRFDEYEQQVRAEYSWVSDDTFRLARASVLQRFLSQKRIYNTTPMRERLELSARANLRRSLKLLLDGSGHLVS